MHVGSYLCLLSIRRQGLPPNKEAYEKHISDLNGKLEVYDKILSDRKYLLGDVREFFSCWYINVINKFSL